MKQPEYRDLFPKVNLLERRSSVTNMTAVQTSKYFEIPGRRGRYIAAGVNTGITGKGAQIAIIDDPFKDRRDADSPTMRARAWDWYTSTLRTRLAPGGGIIVMHTRWHEDDLVGRLLQAQEAGGEKWELVSYPAIAEHDEKFRKEGDALHPERYDLAVLPRLIKSPYKTERFGTIKTIKALGKKLPQEEILIDVKKISEDPNFRDLLGYINTKSDEKRKNRL